MNLAKESPAATPNIVMNMQLIVMAMQLLWSRAWITASLIFFRMLPYFVLGRNIFAAAPETSLRGIRRCIKTIALPAV